MKIQVHSLKFDADQKLIKFIERKMKKLDHFYTRVVDCEVYLKLSNERRENKTVEIKINIPRNQLFSKGHSWSFEDATDQAISALKRQLVKYKERQQAH